MAKRLKKTPLKIFLCHSHKDREAVRALWLRLRRSGVGPWLDADQLQPGQDWQYEIRRAILKSDLVVVCLSQSFNRQPGYRHEELKLALEKAKLMAEHDIFIIPVRLEPCDMPAELLHLQRVDLFKQGGYKKLMHTLREQGA